MGEVNYSSPSQGVIQKYFTANPALRDQFDNDLNQLKAMRYTGKLGDNPQEQYNLITRSLVDRYPDFMRDIAGIYRKEDGGTLIEPGGPGPEQFRQYLADRQVVSQPSPPLYPLASGGAEALAATGGAIAGGLIGGMPGAVAGAAGGGALSAAVVEPALRQAFGLPAKSGGEYATDIALSAGVNAVNELLTGGMMKILGKAQRYLIFGGPTPARLSAQEATELSLLEEGGRLTGQDVMPSFAMMTHAERPGIEKPRNFMNAFADTMTASLGGSEILQRRVFNINRAQNALFTDAIQQLGRTGAFTDSAIAAETITSLHENNYRFSRHMKRTIYSALEGIPGYGNDLPVDTLVQEVTPLLKRLDIASVVNQVNKRTGPVGNDLMDYLIRPAPITQAIPLGTPLPDFDVQELSSITSFVPGSATWAGFSPTGQGLITVATQTGGISPPLPVDPSKLVVMESTSNYAKLHELRSVLLAHNRDSREALRRTSDPKFQREIHDSSYLISLVSKEMVKQVNDNHLPRTVLLGGIYADKIAATEAKTFANRLTNGIIQNLKAEPEKFAQELLKPHNASTLQYIKEAVDSVPPSGYFRPTASSTEGDISQAIQQKTVYSRRSPSLWDTQIQPQLQAESIRGALENQSASAFTGALAKGKAGTFNPGPQFNPDDFVVINPSTLVKNLENSPLDPRTREVIWGSPANYERWVNIAKMMERFDTKNMGARSGIGSFFTVSRQAAGYTLMTFGAMNATQGEDFPKALTQVLGGSLLLASPIVLAKYINDPAKYRALMLGLKQEPKNFFKSRIAVNLAADSLKELAQEEEKKYPVLPGESR